MKKFHLDLLSLDKETIALLDDRQLQNIIGGLAATEGNDTCSCTGGTSACVGKTDNCCGGTSVCGDIIEQQ